MSEVGDMLAAVRHGRMSLKEARRWAASFSWQPTAAQLQDRMTPAEIQTAATWGDIPDDEPNSFDEVEHEHRTGRLSDEQYDALRAGWRETLTR